MPTVTTERYSKRVEVRIDPARWERFKAMCDECEVTLSDGLRQAIDDLYDRYQRGEI